MWLLLFKSDANRSTIGAPSSAADLADVVQTIESGDPKRIATWASEMSDGTAAFMFPGQGSQYVNMGRDLYQTESMFRAQVDRCAEILLPKLGLDLRQTLYPSEAQTDEASKRLNRTLIAQPALFTIEYALAKLLIGWGIEPKAMIGHSVGEYVAACLAGVFSLEDGLALDRRPRPVDGRTAGRCHDCGPAAFGRGKAVLERYD